jgi:hypothetical protein
VENLHAHPRKKLAATAAPPHEADQIDLKHIEKVRRFPYGLRK